MEATASSTIQQAYSEGERAGRLLLPPSLNPHPERTAQHAEWERGRDNAVAAQAAQNLARRITAARQVA